MKQTRPENSLGTFSYRTCPRELRGHRGVVRPRTAPLVRRQQGPVPGPRQYPQQRRRAWRKRALPAGGQSVEPQKKARGRPRRLRGRRRAGDSGRAGLLLGIRADRRDVGGDAWRFLRDERKSESSPSKKPEKNTEKKTPLTPVQPPGVVPPLLTVAREGPPRGEERCLEVEVPRGREARGRHRDEARPELLRVLFFALAAAAVAVAGVSAALFFLPDGELDVLGPLPRRDSHPRDDARGPVQGPVEGVVSQRDGEAGLADREGEARREVEVERVAGRCRGRRCRRDDGGGASAAETETPSAAENELTFTMPPRRSLHWEPRDLSLGRARRSIATKRRAARRLHGHSHVETRRAGGTSLLFLIDGRESGRRSKKVFGVALLFSALTALDGSAPSPVLPRPRALSAFLVLVDGSQRPEPPALELRNTYRERVAAAEGGARQGRRWRFHRVVLAENDADEGFLHLLLFFLLRLDLDPAADDARLHPRPLHLWPR